MVCQTLLTDGSKEKLGANCQVNACRPRALTRRRLFFNSLDDQASSGNANLLAGTIQKRTGGNRKRGFKGAGDSWSCIWSLTI